MEPIRLNLDTRSLAAVGGWFRILMYQFRHGLPVKGHSLHALKFKFREDDVLLIIQINTPGGPKIAFVSADNVEHCLELAAYYVDHKSLGWKEDEYRMRDFDK